MTSKRKFYRSVFQVEVLSEKPISPDMDIRSIMEETIEGDYSGKTTEVVWNAEVDGPTMAKLLQDQASDAGFFGLTEDGEDTEGTFPFEGSHAPDCPYHAGGECLCWRSDPEQNPELEN